jgi:hypothetical protein
VVLVLPPRAEHDGQGARFRHHDTTPSAGCHRGMTGGIVGVFVRLAGEIADPGKRRGRLIIGPLKWR